MCQQWRGSSTLPWGTKIAPVAQLVRASVLHTEGRPFESDRVHHICQIRFIGLIKLISFMELPENFFTTEYLFSTQAPTNKTSFLVLLGLYVLFIIVATLLAYNRKIHPPLRAKFFNFFLTIGIIGVFISLFRWESISYIGSRFVMLLLLIVAIIWYCLIAIYSITKMPREIKLRKNQDRYAQYLPKTKKKK